MQTLTRVICICVMLLNFGCASSQLNYNTLNIASSYNDLITDQIAFNMVKILSKESFLPSFINVGPGTVTTSYGINPSVNIPLNPATSVASSISTATSIAKTKTIASSSLSIGGTSNMSQGWTLDPVTDSDSLRRMKALYLFAICEMKKEDFLDMYPLKIDNENEGIEVTINNMTIKNVDKTQLFETGCIVCADKTQYGNMNINQDEMTVNKKLPHNFASLEKKDDYVSVGIYNGKTLYVSSMEAWSEFVLFMLKASAPLNTSKENQQKGLKLLGAPTPTILIAQ